MSSYFQGLTARRKAALALVATTVAVFALVGVVTTWDHVVDWYSIHGFAIWDRVGYMLAFAVFLYALSIKFGRRT